MWPWRGGGCGGAYSSSNSRPCKMGPPRHEAAIYIGRPPRQRDYDYHSHVTTVDYMETQHPVVTGLLGSVAYAATVPYPELNPREAADVAAAVDRPWPKPERAADILCMGGADMKQPI